MNRTSVRSSDLASVGYDEAQLILEIEFRSGSIYQYFDVPAVVYQRLMTAESLGTYFHAVIRDHYAYRIVRP